MKLASTTLLFLLACHATAFPSSADNEIQQTTGSQEFVTPETNQVKEAGEEAAALSGIDTNHSHFNKCRYCC
jgi:hypothetical protein